MSSSPRARSVSALRLLVGPLVGLLVGLLMTAAVLLASGPPARADADPVGVWPLTPTPTVVRGFDPPTSTYGAGHRGVDLLGHPGEAVRSALPGVVSYAGLLAGRGVVVVDHGPTRTTYEPVTAAVRVGVQVAAGETIGHLEVAPSHCAPQACLHWGWIADPSTYLDPLRLVGEDRPVRLLPLLGLPAPGPAGPAPPGVAAARTDAVLAFLRQVVIA